MPKMITGEEEIRYKEQSAEFSQIVNPKPSEEEREKLRESYLRNREDIKASIKQGEAVAVAAAVAQKVDWGVAMTGAPSLWKKTRGETIKVAILDTGIDRYHQDLIGNIKGGVNFTSSDMNDYQDRNGHGTHCAGIIGAIDNNQGVVGVAPRVELYGVKVLGDDGSGQLSWIIRGMRWAIQNKMDVISMSLGCESEPSRDFQLVFKEAAAAGIPVIVAAGNEQHHVDWPAVYPETIAVGAVDVALEKAAFSNFGEEVDVAAPGVDIFSTYPTNRYAVLSGTSMATPMVTGSVALYLALKKQQGIKPTLADVHNAVKSASVDLGMDGYDVETGYGLLNLGRLLK